jgi:protein O-GlcNAc transferase
MIKKNLPKEKINQGIPKDEVNHLLTLYFSKKFDEAEKLAIKITKNYPTDKLGWKVLGAVFDQKQHVEKAIHVKRIAIKLDPKDPESHFNLSNSLEKISDLEGAKASCESAIHLKPDFAEAYLSLGIIFTRLGIYKSAELNFKKSIALKNNLIRAYIEFGNFKRKNGQLEEALVQYEIAISINPNLPEAHSNLGNVLRDLGKFELAEASYRKAILLNPNFSEAHSNLGNILRDLGQLEEAEASYRKAILIKPSYANAHSNLGNLLRELGRLGEAETHCRKAIALDQSLGEAHSNLANVLMDMKQISEAEFHYREAIRLSPDLSNAYINLGNLLKSNCEFSSAEFVYKKAIQLKPEMSEAHSNLGNLLRDLGRLKEAEDCFRKALDINPNFAIGHNNLGNLLVDLRDYEAAKICYSEAIRIDPLYSIAYSNLGKLYQDTGRLVQAELHCRMALNLTPSFAPAHNNLGNALKDLGDFRQARQCYREAIKLAPGNLACFDNLLFVTNYDEQLTLADVYKEYENYNAVISQLVIEKYHHSKHLDLHSRKIRIGYSSPDFKEHSCRYFIEPIFRNHDRSKFEIYAYSNVPVPDIHTERLKKYFDGWVDVSQMSDKEMAQCIVDNKIDILVDLAGHTVGNRLIVFAMRPAPIQVTYLGYGYTSGLKEIDYFIGDEYLTPLGCEPYFSERLWRIPTPFYCYDPPIEIAPEVSDLPALKNGYITFGSLTRTVRLNDHLLKIWKMILDRVPNSRLRLDQVPFADAETCEGFFRRLEGVGFLRHQIQLSFTKPHWTVYNEIDITLDCFPHNTGTTMLESLWMGVPVLSKKDRPSVGRIGASVLNAIDLNDWIVDDEETYIKKAIEFANNYELLIKLRSSLRERFKKSSIVNCIKLTSNLEAAYIEMIEKRQKDLG